MVRPAPIIDHIQAYGCIIGRDNALQLVIVPASQFGRQVQAGSWTLVAWGAPITLSFHVMDPGPDHKPMHIAGSGRSRIAHAGEMEGAVAEAIPPAGERRRRYGDLRVGAVERPELAVDLLPVAALHGRVGAKKLVRHLGKRHMPRPLAAQQAIPVVKGLVDGLREGAVAGPEP